ncbi:MAG: hypothetical protein ABIK28_12580 [Planctomycetota bacterium]
MKKDENQVKAKRILSDCCDVSCHWAKGSLILIKDWGTVCMLSGRWGTFMPEKWGTLKPGRSIPEQNGSVISHIIDAISTPASLLREKV